MPQVLIYPGAEQLVIDYLTQELADRDLGRPVASRVPKPRPDKFVRVRRLGGPRRNRVVDAATLSVEVWDTLESQAVAVMQLVRGLVNALPGQVLGGYPVYRVEEFSGPSNLPDPASAQIRYSQTFAVHVRGIPEEQT